MWWIYIINAEGPEVDEDVEVLGQIRPILFHYEIVKLTDV